MRSGRQCRQRPREVEEARHLPEHRAPERAEILPESASLKDRIETDIEKHMGGHRTY